MRSGILTLGALALLLGACQQGGGMQSASTAPPPAAKPEAASPMPHREPGLWEMRMTIRGVSTVQQREICLDAGAEPKIALWGAQARSRCSQDSVYAHSDGSYRIAASCDQGSGGHVEVVGSLTGDAAKAYTVRIERTVTGAADAMDDGHFEIATDFRRLGRCKPGQAGGDMTSYGTRINVLAPK